MKQIVIGVPNMQSTHCQTRVNNAVKNIEGVQIQKIEPGKITVSAPTDDAKEKVLNAIKRAGYTVSLEDSNTSAECSTGCCSK